MNNLITQFPDASKRNKKSVTDYGPDNKVFARKFWTTLVRDLVVLFVITIAIIVAALAMFTGKNSGIHNL